MFSRTRWCSPQLPAHAETSAYLLALVSVGVSALLAEVLWPTGRDLSAMLFLPGIMLTARTGGLRPGLFACLLAVLALGVVVWPLDRDTDTSAASFLLAVGLLAILGALSVGVTAHLRQSRHDAEEALARAEAARDHFAEILDSIQDGFFALDHEWRFAYLNRRATELLAEYSAGAQPALQLIGQRVWDLFPAAASSRFNQEAHRALANGSSIAYETYSASFDRWFAVRIYPGRNGLSVYFEDVTESKRVEEQLAQALARERVARARAEATERRLAFLAKVGRVLADSLDYETTLERIARLAVPAIADVCIINMVDADGTIRRIAEAHVDPAKEGVLRELRKYPPRADSDHPVSRAIRTRQPQLYTEYPWEQIDAATQSDDHLRILHELGFTSVIVVPLIARDHVLGAISLHTSSSDRRLTAEDLPLVEALARRGAIAIDNARLYAAQERARAEAEAAVHLRDAFLASVTHDLKNPLTVIKGYSHLLKKLVASTGPGERERLTDILSRVDAAASRMVRLLDELLDVARLEIGQPLVLERQPTDLVALARQTAAAHQQEAEHCVVRFESGLSQLVGLWDPARLERVLDNIVANAVKYSSDESEITIRVGQAEQWAVLEVEDRGIGIPQEDLGRVFERFYRGRNVHGRIPGTGLGLWGSRLVVEQHGGAINLQSQEGQGTTVTVRLPLEEASASQTREAG